MGRMLVSKRIKSFTAAIAVLSMLCPYSLAQNVSAPLSEELFRQPPDSAKPRAWWHWLAGNVSEEGITADLEWMKRVNIAGMQMFDGDLGTPVFVDKPVLWMSPEWKSAWRHAAQEADRLNLEMAMAASGGWSETAGPWVKPEEGMKKYVWSETRIKGGQHFHGTLSSPPTVSGKFQGMGLAPGISFPRPNDFPGAKPQPPAPPTPPPPTYYADAAVVAFQAPEISTTQETPKITSSAGDIDGAMLFDGDLTQKVSVAVADGNPTGWIQFEYSKPIAVQAISLCLGPIAPFSGAAIPNGEIQSSQDGTQWATLVKLPGALQSPAVPFPVRTYSVQPTNARFYRIVLEPKPANPILSMLGQPAEPRHFELAEVTFHSDPRVNYWEDKASFASYIEDKTTPSPEVSARDVIAHNRVIDLTSKMQKDGTLDWQVPPGNWTVLRLGYSLTGEVNHPATAEATGLEVDKLSRKHVEHYMQQYAKMISDTAGSYFGKSFRYFLMDSWEAGQENWTEEMLAEFKKRRGYDMLPYLPVLTGRIVDSAAASDAFLWDFRRTIADLLAENHYQTATNYLKTLGIGLYAEAMGPAIPTTGDGLLNKGQATIPMGEFWTPLPDQEDSPDHLSDVKEATSAAHIYGKPIVATESFTTMPAPIPWGQSPFYLKPLADQNFAAGVNRIVFHTSDQQPFVDEKHKPGMTLGFFGQHYTRNITWAEQAVAWNTYLARCSYLLQQGSYVADAAYFYGEGAPATVPFWKAVTPAAPTHYGFDYLNADVLKQASAENSRLHLKSGMSYRVLVIPDDLHEITLPVLRKLEGAVSAGVLLLAPRPTGSPSLSDRQSTVQYRAIVDKLWGTGDASRQGHVYGKGKVYSGREIESVLAENQLSPDFAFELTGTPGTDVPYSLPHGNATEDLIYLHRHTSDADIYFLSTQKKHSFDAKAKFRVEEKEPEIWHPDTGRTEAVSYSTNGGVTEVPLHFDPEGSLFVIFRKNAAQPSKTLDTLASRQLATVDGAWQLSFPPDWGAPEQIQLPQLESWTQNSDPGVKYFSGTATYQKQVSISQEWLQSGSRLILDLGTVKDFAEVSVNGKSVGGILWKPPFRVDISEAVRPGQNKLEVKVTNLWPNRMIGDLQPGVTKTYTFTDFHAFKKDSPLLESGMLGPVTIQQTSTR